MKRYCFLHKRSSIKDVRRGLFSADIFRKKRGGVLQMRTSAHFGAKNFGFFAKKSMVVRTGREG